ncbi:MAG: hypothetical protein V2J89_11150 [Halieaceae bacterium]|jgi:hypothetical protein|nr:hypothetical protein [Halieaceae bacterium]
MKSFFITLPCSLVVSLLVAEVALETLGIAREADLLLSIVAVLTLLLYERGLAELGIIGAISLFAQINAQGLGSQTVAPDIMLALLIALIIMPRGMRALGVHIDSPRAG